MFKRLAGIFMVFVMLLSIAPAVYAASEEENAQPSIESILDGFYEQIFAIQTEANVNTYSNSNDRLNEIKQETIASLSAAGYLAYDVNPDTYDELEAELMTDFSELELDPNGSYIIVVSGDPDCAGTPNSAEPLSSGGAATTSFTYEYAGHTLRMRYLNVSAAYDPSLKMTDSVSLTADSSSAVERLLNTAISVAMDYIFDPVPLGTIASLLGYEVSWQSSSNAEFVYFAGTNWTRIYTQVLDDESKIWLSWLRVEEVTMVNWITGSVYNTRSNRFERVESPTVISHRYTEHYFDMDWRKLYAAIAWWRGSFRTLEYTGDIYYIYGGKAIITHREPRTI